MKILFVQDMDWVHGIPLQQHHMLERLTRRGHDVVVVDLTSKRRASRLGELISLRPKFSQFSKLLSDSPVILVRSGIVRVPGLANISALILQWLTILWLLTCYTFDVVVINSPISGLFTTKIAKKQGVPVTFLVLDLMQELTEKWYMKKLVSIFQAWLFPRVDRVFPITQCLASFVKKSGGKPRNIKVIPPGVDTKAISPKDSQTRYQLRKKYSLPQHDCIVLFVGSLYGFSGMNKLVLLLKPVIENFPTLRLVIIGFGPLEKKIIQIIEEEQISNNVLLFGRRHYSEVIELLAVSDVGICTFEQTPLTHYAFPIKVFEYMSAGKPVIATYLHGLSEYVSGCGGVRLVSDLNALTKELKSVISKGSLMTEMGSLARSFVLAFDWEKIAELFERELLEVVKNARTDFSQEEGRLTMGALHIAHKGGRYHNRICQAVKRELQILSPKVASKILESGSNITRYISYFENVFNKSTINFAKKAIKKVRSHVIVVTNDTHPQRARDRT